MDSTFKKHLEELDIQGFTVIKDVLSKEELQTVTEKITHIYEQQKEEISGMFDITQTDENDIARAPFVYDDYFYKLLNHPKVIPLIRELLGDYFILFGQNGVIVHPELKHSMSRWHRDLSHQNFVCDPLIAVNVFFCITDFNEKTGATKLVPHTHNIKYPPSDDYIESHSVSVDAPAGSVFLFNTMLFHATGSNNSTSRRIGLSHMYTKYIIKQQIDIPSMLNFRKPEDPFLQMLLGFDSWVPPNVTAYRQFRYEAGLKKKAALALASNN